VRAKSEVARVFGCKEGLPASVFGAVIGLVLVHIVGPDEGDHLRTAAVNTFKFLKSRDHAGNADLAGATGVGGQDH